MTLPKIASIATCVPERRYSQSEIFDYLRPHLDRNHHAEGIFKRIGIDSRCFVIDEEFYTSQKSTAQRNETYMQKAPPLGEAAIRRCLESAGVRPEEITDFTVVSCTGLDIPGIDLRSAGLLGMRPDLHRICVLGMGCYGAMPAIRQAGDALVARPAGKALVLAIELCSLHFQLEDASNDQVVSAALFADGAAAVLLENDGMAETESQQDNAYERRPHLLDSATYCDYQTFDDMAFHLTDQGFRMHLSAYVPRILSADIERFVDGLLERNQMTRSDIRFWMVHPGSPKILDYASDRLGLPAHALDCSRAILSRFGNMSSPTILFVLNEVIQHQNPGRGDYGILLAFGPGLTLEGMLLQWR